MQVPLLFGGLFFAGMCQEGGVLPEISQEAKSKDWDFFHRPPQKLHIQHSRILAGKIHPNRALELWGACRHFINIQMRGAVRQFFSPLPSLSSQGAAFIPSWEWGRAYLLTEQ